MSTRTVASRSTFAPADVVLILGLALMWGVSFLFIKVAVADVGPAWVVAGRTSIGAATLAVILLIRGRRYPTGLDTWRHLAVLGLLSNMLPWLLLAWAEQTVSSGLTAVLNSLTPSMTLVVAVAIGLEGLTAPRVLGLLLALGGTTLAVWHELGADGGLGPILAITLATVLYGMGAVYAKRTVSGGRFGPLQLAAGQILISAVVMTTSALVLNGLPRGLEADSVGSLLGLGALGTGLAFLVFYRLLDSVGATSTTLFTYLIPVVGLVAGAVVLDEEFGPNVIAGLVVIVGGIWLAQREPLPASSPEPELEILVADE